MYYTQLAEELREDGATVLVGAHPALAERLVATALERRLLPLPAELRGYTRVLRQQTVLRPVSSSSSSGGGGSAAAADDSSASVGASRVDLAFC